MTDFDRLATPDLWALRLRMIEGNERTGLAMLEGRASMEAREAVHVRVMLVDRLDAVLLARGETVPLPFWLEDEPLHNSGQK